jgi:molybdopterin-synthase adenylyltransferase
VSDLCDEELERYARHIVLPQLGGVGQRKLKAASIAIVGAGGIGSAVIPALAGAGIGRLTIIDDDVVDRTNLQRQPIFRDDQVGDPKAELAAAFVEALNPHVRVSAVRERLTADNAETLLSGHDLVIDACDNFATRLVVGFRGWGADKPCYRCFVGDAFDTDDCDTCAEQGVLGAFTATVGSFAALMAIRAMAGIGDDVAGSLFLFDGVKLDWRKIRLPKDPNCRTCSA